MVRFMLGWVGRLLLIGFVLVIVLAVLWLLAGRMDVPLSAESKACLRPELERVPAEQNAFFAVLGMDVADPDADINRVGQEVLADYLRWTAAGSPPEEADHATRAWLNVFGKTPVRCRPLFSSCLESAARTEQQLQQFEQDNALLLKRYHSLYSYSRFQEVAVARREMFSQVLAMHSLTLAQTALQVHRGQQAEALELLARDTEFWRVLLRDGSLLSKSGGARAMLENVVQLSEILSSQAVLSARDQSLIEGMLQAPSAAEMDLGPSIRGIFCEVGKGGNPGLDKRLRESDLIQEGGMFADALTLVAKTGLRPNHTLNLTQELAKRASEGGIQPARHFGDSVWDYAYNPVGKGMVYRSRINASTFEPHRERLTDLDGLIRLVRLQWEIKKQNIRAADVPAFLAANPVTQQKIRWDANRNVLWLARLESKEGELRVFEAPRDVKE